MSIVKRMDLSWIIVSDLEKAKQFYTEVLGLIVHEYTQEYKWLEVIGKDGGMLLGICEENESCGTGKAGSNAVVTMLVENILTAKDTLTSKGVTFHGPIIEVPGQVKMATFTDADGNKFQLVETVNK